MPTHLLHRYVSMETRDSGTLGSLLADYLCRWGVCSREDSHDPALYNHNGSPVSMDSRVHIAADSAVHKDPLFRRMCRVAMEYAGKEGLVIITEKPAHVSDEVWASQRYEWNGHVAAEVALDKGLFGMHHHLVDQTRRSKRSADLGEVAEAVGGSLGVDRGLTYNTLVERLPEVFDGGYSYGFFREYGGVMDAILRDERVGLGSESAVKDFFRHIVWKTGDNLRRIEKGEPLSP